MIVHIDSGNDPSAAAIHEPYGQRTNGGDDMSYQPASAPTKALPAPHPSSYNPPQAAAELEVDIASVEVDPSLLARAASGTLVQDYAGALERGQLLPPITVIRNSTGYLLVDGLHRLQAHIKAGNGRIAVRLIDGDRKTALAEAIRLNTTHGVRLTRQEKQAAIERLLSDDYWRTQCSTVLATIVGTSHQTVLRRRQQLQMEPAHGESKLSYTNKQGKTMQRTATSKRQSAFAAVAAERAAAAPPDIRSIRDLLAPMYQLTDYSALLKDEAGLGEAECLIQEISKISQNLITAVRQRKASIWQSPPKGANRVSSSAIGGCPPPGIR